MHFYVTEGVFSWGLTVIYDIMKYSTMAQIHVDKIMQAIW